MIRTVLERLNFPLKYLLARTVFPVVMLGVLFAAYCLVEGGMKSPSVLGLVSMMAMVFIVILEKLIPFRVDWNKSRGDIVTDILHNIFSSYIAIEVAKLALLMALLPVAVVASSKFGSALWPEQWPIVIRLALAAILVEFGCYWVHRASHETAFLWRFHSIHHSPERLYWLNAGRDHPIGAILTTVASIPLVIIVGVDGQTMVLYYVMQSIHGLFQHANINVRLGWLNWVFSMAELHRWHHSAKIEEANNNYGLTLICWDVLFGTRILPHLDGPGEIGIKAMPRFPQSYWQQLTIPFRWRYWQRVAGPEKP